jgi:hypothetical protein
MFEKAVVADHEIVSLHLHGETEGRHLREDNRPQGQYLYTKPPAYDAEMEQLPPRSSM